MNRAHNQPSANVPDDLELDRAATLGSALDTVMAQFDVLANTPNVMPIRRYRLMR